MLRTKQVAIRLIAALSALRASFEMGEIRTSLAFSAMPLSTRALVIVHQGTPQRVVVEAGPDDRLKRPTTVVSNQLRIYSNLTSTHIGPFELNWRTAPSVGLVMVSVTLPTVGRLTVRSRGCLHADTLQAHCLT